MKFGELYVQVARAALRRQDERTGAMPPGQNGPYRDRETPVRNTAHWLQAFLRAWQWTGGDRYRQAAERCAQYLVGPDAPRNGAHFEHRTTPGKDRCNGLIGPAWTIEALVAAYEHLDSQPCLRLAREIFKSHPVQAESGLWIRVEPDGELLTPDLTFNHQLWFCAMAVLLSQYEPEARRAGARFLDRVRSRMSLSLRGRIHHPVRTLRGRSKRMVKRILRREHVRALRLKEIGYHAFNLYAFALIYSVQGNHPFFSTRAWRRALSYRAAREFSHGIQHSLHGFPYNPPGFEMPFVNEVFATRSESLVTSRTWLRRQVDYGYDARTHRLSHGTEDPETATARIYECWRFSDDLLNLDVSG